ncbi:MAG: PleD family two-component system response regulator [Wujia sp.]
MEKIKVLVIDDNTVNLATIEKELKNRYNIIPMISGKRALKFLYCQRVDLILLDVEMPEMDGVETLEEIRKLENSAHTPVIFLTAKKDKHTVLEGFRLGIMDYITKPFDVEDVAQRIDYTLKRVGKLPFDKKEIYKIIEVIIRECNSGDDKRAFARLIEMLNYKTDEEILGRVKVAIEKYNSGDIEAAINMVMRIQKMLIAELGEDANSETMLNSNQIKSRLKDVLEDLDSFKTKEAVAKCKELQKCKLPKYVGELIAKTIEYLNNYDDEEAEKILRGLEEQLH